MMTARNLRQTTVLLACLAFPVLSPAATFDIGIGDFPRGFSTFDDGLTSLVDSSGNVIAGFVDVGGPATLEYTTARFAISASSIVIGAGSSLKFDGVIELSAASISIAGGSIVGLSFVNSSGGSPVVAPIARPILSLGPVIIPGGSITTIGGSLTVQSGSGSVVDWQTFQIPAGSGTLFVQGRGQGSAVLNGAGGNNQNPLIGILVPNASVVSSVPEPSGYLMMAFGMAIIGFVRRRASR